MNLTINVSTSSTEDVTACNSYDWNGNTYTASGTYTFITTSANGCDSTAILNLTLNGSGLLSAGPDQVVEIGQTVQLAGSFNGGSTVPFVWITGGGLFTPDNTDPLAQYLPSADENTAGSAVLVLQSVVPGCGTVTDTVVIYLTTPTAISNLHLGGVRSGTKVDLNWVSTNESNSIGFVVEKSYDGVNYNSIAQVATKAPGGNYSGSLNYAYTDNNCFGGVTYYRLRHLSIDNRVKFSNIVAVDGLKGNLADMIYPNPASSFVNVLISSTSVQNGQISVYDMNGKKLKEFKVNLINGSVTYKIQTDSYPSGSYIITLKDKNGSGRTIGSFIKR